MGRGLIYFTVMMVFTGIGTIAFIEYQTKGQIVETRDLDKLNSNFKRHYYSVRIKLRHWWRKTSRKISAARDSVTSNSSNDNANDMEIVKWQDENGQWHIEARPAAPPAQE